MVAENQKTKAVLNKYSTEIRKYGGGLILASQLIDHFNDEILANIAVKLCMKAENKKEAQKNYKYFNINPNQLINLGNGEGIITGLHKDAYKIKISPIWERD